MTIPGMQPAHDMEHADTKYTERMEQLDRPHGREISARSRTVATWIAVAIVVAGLATLVVAWIGVISAG